MRLPTAMLVTCMLMAVAAPALGASHKDHDDCNADDPDRNIAGCTIVVQDLTEKAKTRANAYVGRGLAWQIKGNRDRAISDFTDAIRLNPKDALAYNNRGLAWNEKGDHDRAIADLTAAIRIDPLPRSDLPGMAHVNIYANRGLAWQAKGDLDRGIADFDQAIRLDPRDADAFNRRGAAWSAMGQLDRAISDFTIAIGSNPKY
jgi:tetratricopeptide (TPR) repeat protein